MSFALSVRIRKVRWCVLRLRSIAMDLGMMFRLAGKPGYISMEALPNPKTQKKRIASCHGIGHPI